MGARLATLLALLCTAGCWIDFDRFQPPRDAGADLLDSAAPDVPDPVDAFDAPVEPPPPDAPVADRVVDRPAACTPGRALVTQIRVAHMAPEVGPIDLCMQKRGGTPTTSMARFQTPRWPSDGLDYGEVSLSVPLNETVVRTNEAWDVAVVARGTPCDRVPADITPLATRSIQLDPNTLRMIVVTAEPALDGHLVPFINLLPDENCTDCTALSVDVRAVHAALGASSQRLTFTMVPQEGPPPTSVAAMQTFATGVSYGGDQGYACNQLWGTLLTGRTRVTAPIQFEVSTSAGRLVARSETLALKVVTLGMFRTATVFFEGEFSDEGVPGPQAPGFVVCYDGVATGTLSTCERVAARLNAPDAGVDPPPGDASNGDGPGDDAPGDDAPGDDVPTAIDGVDGSAP
jgi:hypothetical protein